MTYAHFIRAVPLYFRRSNAFCFVQRRAPMQPNFKIFLIIRHARVLAAIGLISTLANCGTQSPKEAKKGFTPTEYGVTASPRLVEPGQAVPRGGGVYRVGKAYQVRGKTYQPRFDPTHDEIGLASWYGDDFHGRRTANGEIYNMHAFSAAHKTLPLPSFVRVTNVKNGRSVIVRVNDRGPFHGDRVIDLSKRTAQVLDFQGHGVAKVRVTYVGAAPLDGQDDWLVTTVRSNGTPIPPSQVAAPVPGWAQHRVSQPSPVQAALADTLAPLPAPRPRDEPVQLASLNGFVPTASAVAKPSLTPLPHQQNALSTGAVVNAATPPIQTVSTPALPPPLAPKDIKASGSNGSSLVLSLNVGSFRDPSEAFRLRDQLANHGQAVVDPINLSGITLYQLRVSPLFGQAAADTALQDAKARGALGARLLPL